MHESVGSRLKNCSSSILSCRTRVSASSFKPDSAAPSRATSPEVARSSPPIKFNSDDLPDPDGPTGRRHLALADLQIDAIQRRHLAHAVKLFGNSPQRDHLPSSCVFSEPPCVSMRPDQARGSVAASRFRASERQHVAGSGSRLTLPLPHGRGSASEPPCVSMRPDQARGSVAASRFRASERQHVAGSGSRLTLPLPHGRGSEPPCVSMPSLDGAAPRFRAAMREHAALSARRRRSPLPNRHA